MSRARANPSRNDVPAPCLGARWYNDSNICGEKGFAGISRGMRGPVLGVGGSWASVVTPSGFLGISFASWVDSGALWPMAGLGRRGGRICGIFPPSILKQVKIIMLSARGAFSGAPSVLFVAIEGGPTAALKLRYPRGNGATAKTFDWFSVEIGRLGSRGGPPSDPMAHGAAVAPRRPATRSPRSREMSPAPGSEGVSAASLLGVLAT